MHESEYARKTQDIPEGAIYTLFRVFHSNNNETAHVVIFANQESLEKIAAEVMTEEAPNFLFFICGIHHKKASF